MFLFESSAADCCLSADEDPDGSQRDIGFRSEGFGAIPTPPKPFSTLNRAECRPALVNNQNCGTIAGKASGAKVRLFSINFPAFQTCLVEGSDGER